MEPTIGRIVHLHVVDSALPFAAIITRVWNPMMVNLAVFNHDGSASARTSVYFGKDNAPEGSAYCDWPPRT